MNWISFPGQGRRAVELGNAEGRTSESNAEDEDPHAPKTTTAAAVADAGDNR